jgi:hypothetical protein
VIPNRVLPQAQALSPYFFGGRTGMTRWQAMTEIVRAFLDRGKPGYALAALAMMLVVTALVAAAIWATASALVDRVSDQPQLRGSSSNQPTLPKINAE